MTRRFRVLLHDEHRRSDLGTGVDDYADEDDARTCCDACGAYMHSVIARTRGMCDYCWFDDLDDDLDDEDAP